MSVFDHFFQHRLGVVRARALACPARPRAADDLERIAARTANLVRRQSTLWALRENSHPYLPYATPTTRATIPPSRNASPIELANSPIVNGQPRSFSTTMVLAIHGTKSVIVTMATSS